MEGGHSTLSRMAQSRLIYRKGVESDGAGWGILPGAIKEKSMINKIRCFLGFHKWEVFQHNIRADENKDIFVFAWKQCRNCAKSKFVHALQ